jgi:septal ring factor EnvC (AmiA/AmiB activator)
MTNSRGRIGPLALLTGVAVFVGGIVVIQVAGWSADPKGQTANPKRELEQLQRQLDQKKRQQQSAVRKERSVLEELEGFDRRMQSSRRQIVLLDRQLREQRRKLDQLGGDVAALRETVDGLQRQVAARLRAVYMSGVDGEWATLLGAGDAQELLERFDFLQRVAAREARLLAEYERQRADLEVTLRAHTELSEQLNQSRRELAGRLDEMSDAKSQKRALLAKIQTERSMTTKAIAELESAAEQLQELLKQLEREAQQRKKSTGRLAQAKGRLPWPQNGAVVGLFGRQRHSQYNMNIFRRGIDIQAADGSPVKAVHQAVVAYADWFKGYGLVVVLDHGDHYYTLYAHLGKVLVTNGQAVEQGQVIGEVGETGAGNDATLYFELRHHGTPMDPLQWLKKKGKG